MMEFINANRLELFPATIPLLNSALKGDAYLAKALSIEIEPGWNLFGKEVFDHVKNHLVKDENEKGWWMYFIILKSNNTLIGTGGFKGGPTPEGSVEIGYEIVRSYRGKGLATEFATALIKKAFGDPRVNCVFAHTLPYVNASTRVLEKCKFMRVGLTDDPDDGIVWKWEIRK